MKLANDHRPAPPCGDNKERDHAFNTKWATRGTRGNIRRKYKLQDSTIVLLIIRYVKRKVRCVKYRMKVVLVGPSQIILRSLATCVVRSARLHRLPVAASLQKKQERGKAHKMSPPSFAASTELKTTLQGILVWVSTRRCHNSCWNLINQTGVGAKYTSSLTLCSTSRNRVLIAVKGCLGEWIRNLLS